MSTKERKCEERIEDYFANLETSCTDLLKGYFDGGEEGFANWCEYPLAVSSRKETKIELSYGGPSDFLTVIHDGTEIYTVTYHFLDWFDGASRVVGDSSPVWEYARTIIEAREECGL